MSSLHPSVLVDARGLRISGIGRYLREVLAGLLQDERFGHIKILGDVAEVEEFLVSENAEDRASVVPFRYGFYSVRAQVAWRALERRGALEVDAAFFPHYDAPWSVPPRSVVTVHDLTHLKVPEAFAAWQRAAARVLLRRVTTHASRVIAVSNSTARDLLQEFPQTEGKIEVIPNGVTSCFLSSSAPGSSPAATALLPDAPYMLCVGNRKPHKNLRAAVEVLALLRREQPDLRLVIVGPVYPGWDEVVARANTLGIRDAVIEIPPADDVVLRELYTNCSVFLFPSLYEGFGLPLLEAMACGAPVVASNRASIPEVVSNAGLLVDPRDYRAMADAVLRVIDNTDLRRALRCRGKERVEHFSWEKAAQSTGDVLYQVALHEDRSPVVAAG